MSLPRLAVALAVTGFLAAEGHAASDASGGEIRIGHSYSSSRALRQPATFVFLAEGDRPVLTVLDAGFLYEGPFGGRGGFETGGRISAGSARAKPARVFGAIGRGWWRAAPLWEPLLLSLAGEYLADGAFEVQEGSLTLETTIIGGPPGLGRPVHREKLPVSWRPWLGVAYGSSSARGGATATDPDGFFRAHARIEVTYARGGSEMGLEAASWLVEGHFGGTHYVKGALSVPVSGGLFLVASGEAGRQPPRFAHDRRLGMGLGFRL